MSWAESAAPDAADLQDRPARFTPPPSLDPSGLIQTLTARPWRRRRPSASPGVWCLKVLHAVDAPPLTPPYNAPKLLADTSLDRRRITGISARSPAEHANSNPGCACQALCAAAPRATAPQSHAPSLAAAGRAEPCTPRTVCNSWPLRVDGRGGDDASS